MKLFRRKTQEFESLPDQITANDLIECWHNKADGTLGYLVVEASAKSAESIDRFWRRVALSLVGAIFGGTMLKSVVVAKMTSVQVAGASWLAFWITGGLFAAVVFWLHRRCVEKRICTVSTETLIIEEWSGTRNFVLTQVVGVQRHLIDQQRIDEERRRYRKQRNPRLKMPFSNELVLETDLGQTNLGAVFGLKEARDITDAMNTAIQFMKGRTATGAGAIVNPRFQYKGKTAGQIPE